MRQSLSTPVGSTSGAPEGDPCSVLAMIALSTVVATLLPMVAPHFYVDNWSWLATRPGAHEEAITALLAFTDSVRLVVDWKKSYTWSVHPASRKWLRKSLPRCLPDGVSLPILSHVRELGVQLQFGRKICLQHVCPKLAEAVRRLRVLFHEPSPPATKARVIQSGIFPHAFFGSFNAAPGKHRIHRLRSLAARALVGRHHTMSAYAAMYLHPGLMDPEVFLLWSHAAALHRAFQVQPEIAEEVLLRAQQGPFTSIFGPATALRALLDRNDWSITEAGIAKGPDHWSFCFRHSGSRSIAAAVEGAWAERVQSECVHRAGLCSLGLPCKALTSQVLRSFKPWQQAILARHMSGAFMSGAEKSVWSRLDCLHCELCGEVDSKHHRIHTCPALQSAREEHLSLLATVADEFPEWTHLTVATQHKDSAFFRLACQARALPPVLPAVHMPCRLQLFTDGSATNSSIPVARLTYWAVVISASDGSPEACQAWAASSSPAQAADFRVLVQGSTPKAQTIPRAELSALAWTAQWLKHHAGMAADLYTDSAYAVSVWQTVVATGSISRLTGDLDLAACLLQCDQLRVYKVKAHATLAMKAAATPSVLWQLAGNEAADAAARGARAQELLYMRNTANDIAADWLYQRDHLSWYCSCLIDLNVADIRFKEAQATAPTVYSDEARTRQVDHQQRSLMEWTRPQNLGQPEVTRLRLHGVWGGEFLSSLYEWARLLTWLPLPQPVQDDFCCTYLELMVNWVIWSGTLPPTALITSTGREYVPSLSLRARLQPQTLEDFTGTFQAALLHLAAQDGTLLPARRLQGIPDLKALGLPKTQLGLDRRPLFPAAEGWVPVLSDTCRIRNASLLIEHCRSRATSL